VPISEHDYGIPDEDELAQLVGAATPHFAFQIHSRVQGYARALPPDHPRQAELRRHLARLERLGFEGQDGGADALDLPPLPSLIRPAEEAAAPGAAPGRATPEERRAG
jgi:hypothetical protein